MLTEKQAHLQGVLDQLSAAPGIRGALLISRDGFCMMNRLRSLQAAETFSAMSATLLGAAEAAFHELGDGAPRRLVAEGETARVVLIGADHEMLLVAVAEPAGSKEDVIGRVEAAATNVGRILRG